MSEHLHDIATQPRLFELSPEVDRLYTLKVGPAVSLEKELDLHNRVRGTFTGTVQNVRIKTNPDAQVQATYVVEVDGLTLE